MRGIIVEEWDDIEGCTLEGCRGHLVQVRWADGDLTENCSNELDYHPNDAVTLRGQEE